MNESINTVNPVFLSDAQRSAVLANGYPWLPGSGKAVYLDGWQKMEVTPDMMDWLAAEIPQWESWRNTGLQLGRVVIAADNDIADGELAAKVQAHVENRLGSSPCIRIGSKGQAGLYRVNAPMRSIVIRGIQPGCKDRRTAVEFLGLERQLMSFGMHPDTQQPYRWPDKSPLNTPVSDLPLAAHADVFAAANDIRDELVGAGWADVRITETATEADKDSAYKDVKKGNGGLVSLTMLTNMLSHIDPGIGRKESSSWISVLGALKHAEACELVCDPKTHEPDPDFDAEAVAVAWSRGDYWKDGQPGNFKGADDVEKNFATLSPFAPKGATIASLVRMARDGGYKGPSRIDSLMDRFEIDGDESNVNAGKDVAEGGNAGDLYNPWTEYDAPAFPLNILPDDMRDFINGNAVEMGADSAAIAMACLAALSGAVSHEIRLKLTTTHFASPRLWVLQVGRPSSSKTPTQNVALSPLRKVQSERWKAHRQAIATAEANGASEEAIKKFDEENGPPALITNDLTVEVLAQLLSRQNRGVLIHKDELSGWIGAMDKYASGKGAAADRAIWLQAYDGGPYDLRRISRKTTPVENLSISILGGIQPARLKQFSDLQTDGLLQRFLPVMLRGGREDQTHDTTQVAAKWDVIVRRMLDYKHPAVLRLSREAAEEYRRIKHELFVLTDNDTLGDGFASFIGKLKGVWGSLALLLHLAWGGDTYSPVSGETAKRASRLLEEFIIPHAHAFYESMAEDTQGDHRAIGACLVGLQAEGWKTVKAKDLYHKVKCCRIPANDMPTKLLPFVAGGWLEPVTDGPWCREWIINPGVQTFGVNAAEHRKMVAAIKSRIQETNIEKAAT